MEDYIIFNNDDDMTTYTMLMEAYTDEADIIQEGKILDEAIGKGKKENILIKIFKFLPRLVRSIAGMIRKKLRDRMIDRKIKAIEKWLAEEHVKESYEYDDGEDHIIYTEAGRPIEDLLKSHWEHKKDADLSVHPHPKSFELRDDYWWEFRGKDNIFVSTTKFKKLDKLAIELVNEIKSCPDIASELVVTINRLADTYARAARDSYDMYMKDYVREKNGVRSGAETNSELAKRLARESYHTLDPKTITRYAINPKKRGELYDDVMTGKISREEARSRLREEAKARFETGDKVRPGDVQHQCNAIEKRIIEHSEMIVKISKKLQDELKAVKKIQDKNAKKPGKEFKGIKQTLQNTIANFDYGRYSTEEALKYINNIRKNMLFCSIELDKSARLLDKCNMTVMNPMERTPMESFLGNITDSVIAMKNDYNKISAICSEIVNFLVDEINALFEYTGIADRLKKYNKYQRDKKLNELGEFKDDKSSNSSRADYSKTVFPKDASSKYADKKMRELVDDMKDEEKQNPYITDKSLDDRIALISDEDAMDPRKMLKRRNQYRESDKRYSDDRFDNEKYWLDRRNKDNHKSLDELRELKSNNPDSYEDGLHSNYLKERIRENRNKRQQAYENRALAKRNRERVEDIYNNYDKYHKAFEDSWKKDHADEYEREREAAREMNEYLRERDARNHRNQARKEYDKKVKEINDAYEKDPYGTDYYRKYID